MRTLKVTTARGIPMIITDHDGQGVRLVQFFDNRYKFTDYGQFISSYYASTLLEDPRINTHGLCLQGGVTDWDIDPNTYRTIDRWLREDGE